ncbi:MAG TPA: hypothetical protein VH639_21920 [Bryobacteraceae bacterium]
MTERSQLLHDRDREVLVRIEPGHSGRFILADLLIDLIDMRPRVSPRIHEIFGAERGIRSKQRFL